jgi:hypothetical protein
MFLCDVSMCSVGKVMIKPVVVLIGADKGGVGKTTITRTLLDYFSVNEIRARAFDTETPKGSLKRFHPNITDIVDINTVPDQMKIFDTLTGHHAVTVIDIRAGLMTPTLRMLDDIGFLRAAQEGQVTFALFHILGPTIASLEEIPETASYFNDTRYFLVKNCINDSRFFEWHEATHSTYFNRFKNAVELTVPKLNEMAMEQVDIASTSFVQFIGNKAPNGIQAAYSLVLRGYVHSWLSKVWAEYDRVGLAQILQKEDRNAESVSRLRPVAKTA